MFSISCDKIRLVSLEINQKHGRDYEKKRDRKNEGGGGRKQSGRRKRPGEKEMGRAEE